MYCFTCVNNLNCVFNELSLWGDISSEHPSFIKAVGELSNKKIPQELINKLSAMSYIFSEIKKKSEDIRMQTVYNQKEQYNTGMQLKELIKEFLKQDKSFFDIIEDVKSIGKEDEVWQTLLQHIIEEQRFMYQLFTNILMQIR